MYMCAVKQISQPNALPFVCVQCYEACRSNLSNQALLCTREHGSTRQLPPVTGSGNAKPSFNDCAEQAPQIQLLRMAAVMG